MHELAVVSIRREEAILKVPDGTIRAVPLWMTDNVICHDIRESPYPYCSCNALQRVRRLLESLGQGDLLAKG